ncbi:hypothetical protein [Nocardia mikamii]|uniref:hypothetical protein n=1 Tax=Nocardia mikamii TaxID=508464 RepID=UPI0007A51BB2|nr:hypothetical protein [Nocardia mikamii]
MKKLGTLTLIGAATAAALCGGAGLAAADDAVSATPVVAPGEPDPTGTGSASGITDLVKALSSGSAQAATPAR